MKIEDADSYYYKEGFLYIGDQNQADTLILNYGKKMPPYVCRLYIYDSKIIEVELLTISTEEVIFLTNAIKKLGGKFVDTRNIDGDLLTSFKNKDFSFVIDKSFNKEKVQLSYRVFFLHNPLL